MSKLKGRLPDFVPVFRETMNCPAWKALSFSARALYIAIKARKAPKKNCAYLSYRNALKEAVAQARTKAETLATASNSTLGKITAIVESGGAAPMPMALGAAKDSSVPIEPGTQKIEATVSVTFALG